VSCSYDDQDRLIACGGVDYAFTDDGALSSRVDTTSGATTSYEHGPLGELTRVVLPDGTEVRYLLDGLGRRVGKLVDGVLVAQWLWSDSLRIAAELDGAGNLVARFVYATRVNVPDLVIMGGATYRVIHDHLGSPLYVLDTSTGAVVQERRFDAWGNTLVDTNPGFIPFGFAGGLEDLDTGLVRFGARDYDPELGRWASKDPIGFGGGDPNLYGYVLGDPVNRGDPDGRYASLAGALLAPLASTAVVTAGLAMFVDLFGNVRPEATREGTARFGDGTLRGDCFRHCYGACLAAARYGGAAELIDYREPRGPSGQQDIDNNTAGRDICAEEGLEALDDHARAACGQGCEEAVASGALQCELL
jgi:RHS repeat-associated protein